MTLLRLPSATPCNTSINLWICEKRANVGLARSMNSRKDMRLVFAFVGAAGGFEKSNSLVRKYPVEYRNR